jgi:hypothetical protein
MVTSSEARIFGPVAGRLHANSVRHPLYYFTATTKPGQVNGQGVSAFGAHWDAVRPTGAQAG